jgi:hypothetical protein
MRQTMNRDPASILNAVSLKTFGRAVWLAANDVHVKRIGQMFAEIREKLSGRFGVRPVATIKE